MSIMSFQLTRFEMAVGNESGGVRGWKSAWGRVIQGGAQLNSSLSGIGFSKRSCSRHMHCRSLPDTVYRDSQLQTEDLCPGHSP